MNIIYIERQFATQMAYRMSMTTDHSRGVEIKYNFRCPICGDSASDKYKTRGWFYESDGHVRFGCFNCNRNMVFSSYLYEYEREVYREFAKEKFSQSNDGYVDVVPKKVDVVEKKIESNLVLPYSTCLTDLDQNHPVIKWMNNRKIPKDKHYLFFFTDNWKKLANSVKPETYRYDDQKEFRLVIPIYNKDMSYSSLQGRALSSNVEKSQRYLTIKVDDHASKVYGVERVDPNKDVYMLEGPIDSVFIPNACAIVGGTMSLDDAPFEGKRIWVLDNEPRSIDTINRLEKMISYGERVVVWDDCPFESKDINDMIKDENATVEEIMDFIKSHTYSGLAAINALRSWRKVGKTNIKV